MHGDREGSNALLRSAPGAMLEASCPTDGPSALIPAMLKDAERAVSSMSPWSSFILDLHVMQVWLYTRFLESLRSEDSEDTRHEEPGISGCKGFGKNSGVLQALPP